MRYAILAALALSACAATPDMVAQQRAVCAEIGYPAESLHMGRCIERMVLGQTEAQSRILASVAGISLTAAYNQILWSVRR